MFGSLRPQGLQHARLSCPSLSPGACSNSCPLSWWCRPTTWSCVIPFCHSVLVAQHTVQATTVSEIPKTSFREKHIHAVPEVEPGFAALQGKDLAPGHTAFHRSRHVSQAQCPRGWGAAESLEEAPPGATGRAVQLSARGPGISPKQHLSYRDHHSSHGLINPEQTLEFWI